MTHHLPQKPTHAGDPAQHAAPRRTHVPPRPFPTEAELAALRRVRAGSAPALPVEWPASRRAAEPLRFPTAAERQAQADQQRLLDAVRHKVDIDRAYERGQRHGQREGRRAVVTGYWWWGVLFGLALGCLLTTISYRASLLA